ncbi:pol polyprotein [Streptococcus agalactiae]
MFPKNFEWYQDIHKYRHPNTKATSANQITFAGTCHNTAVSILFDTGAFNAVDYNLVKKLGLKMIKLPFPTKVTYFNGQSDSRATINYGCNVPLNIGTYTAIVPCLVTWVDPTHPVVFGMQWFRTTYPNMVHELLKLGGGEQTKPDVSEPLIAASVNGNLYSVNNNDRSTVLLAAISTEENNRTELQEKFKQIIELRCALAQAIDDKEHTLQMRSAAATNTQVGSINGLTGNAEGWRDTIPKQYHRFCDTVFSDESASELPPHRTGVDCEITLTDGAKYWQEKLYDMPLDQQKVLKQYLDTQLQRGFIQPSKSPVASAVFFVTDKASQSRGTDQLRLVVDYRTLNSRITLDEYPLPLTREIIDRLGKAKVFTKFDVRAGFNNIRVAPGHEWKLAFKTMYGLYEYTVMPMGLATAPSIFQRFMNMVLAPYLGLFCFAYLDDIIVFSDNKDQHEEHVTKVLEAMEAHKLHLKPIKCVWNTTTVDFLGYTAVANKGVKMADDKIQAIRNWERPKTLRDTRAFNGLANFYGKFVPHYSDLMKPLYNLTKKGAEFNWTPECQIAFDTVKQAMKNDLFLSGFDWNKPATLETDASDVAYAGIISQTDDHGDLRPVLMYSHTFTNEQMNWPAHDKELYAIVFGFSRYRHFLQTRAEPVKVYSDHRALSHFMKTTDLSKRDRHRRWAEELSQYNFQIQYRPGVENTVADCLSRYNLGEGQFENVPLLPSWRFSEKARKSLDHPSQWSPTAVTGAPS